LNGNGVRDQGDPPLPGVTFHVNDILNGYSDVGDADGPSDWKGEVQLTVWLPGCPDARFEVYPDTPPGYRALSDSRPTADDGSSNIVFGFGFSQLPGLPTIAPRSSPPSCVSYHLGAANKYDITDIDIAADGSVWVATFNDGLRRLPPSGTEWVFVRTGDGLINNQVRSITPLADGSVWFGTEGGASRLSPEGWTSFTSADGLVNNNVYGIALSPSGDVWFATAGGVSRLDAQTLTWNSVSSELVTAIAVSPEGIPWTTPYLDDQVRVVEYDSEGLHLGNGLNFNYADQLTFSSDGIMWIAGSDGIGQYNPVTGVVNIFDRTSTGGAFVDSANSLAIAPDGSVWIAATAYTPIVYHFLPWLDKDMASAWQIYDQRDGLLTLPTTATNDDSVKAIAVTPSGDVWIATTEHATRCHFEN
jgi:streptogramin lyase